MCGSRETLLICFSPVLQSQNTQGFDQIKRTLLQRETKPLPHIEATKILTNISINDPRITFVYKSLGLFPQVRLSHPSYGTFKPV